MLKHKHKKRFLISFALLVQSLLVSSSLIFGISPVSAAVQENCPDGYTITFNPGQGPGYAELCANHQTGGPASDDSEGGGEVVENEEPATGESPTGDCQTADEANCGIIRHLVTFMKALSAVVGVVVVIMITVGGIQYSSARDNPQAAAAAKGRITNAILALVAYLFIFAFLQWLVPGGIL